MRDDIELVLARQIDERIRQEAVRDLRLRLVVGCALTFLGSLLVMLAAA